MVNNDNKIITQWLGKCWHELAELPSELPHRFHFYRCIHCGVNEANINYFTSDGFFILLNALKEKGITYTIDNHNKCFITLYKNQNEIVYLPYYGFNLQDIFIKAVLEFIIFEKKLIREI